MKTFLIKNKLNLLIIFAWLIIVIFCIYYHEAWNDEMLSYYFLKNYSITDIINRIQISEGHPILWYIIQFPFCKMGITPKIVHFLSFIFMFSAVIYFCIRSPFNYLTKILFIF